MIGTLKFIDKECTGIRERLALYLALASYLLLPITTGVAVAVTFDWYEPGLLQVTILNGAIILLGVPMLLVSRRKRKELDKLIRHGEVKLIVLETLEGLFAKHEEHEEKKEPKAKS